MSRDPSAHSKAARKSRCVGYIRCVTWQHSSVAWSDALVGGGFALAGVALQQGFAMRQDRSRHRRARQDREHAEQHAAFVDLVKVARRVQRALVDLAAAPEDEGAHRTLAHEIDRLTEAVAAIRLVVPDEALVSVIEDFEEQAKDLERAGRWQYEQRLRLTPLIDSLRQYQARTAAM